MYYSNPTEDMALAHIRKEERKRKRQAEREAYEERRNLRPVIYLSSPYSDGDIQENVLKAQYYSKFAAGKGVIPIAPHLLFTQFMDEVTERDEAMEMNMSLVGRCKELWVFGEKISAGMKAEIEMAKKLRRKIRYFSSDLEEVKSDV